MNVTESCDVNTLIGWLLGRQKPSGGLYSSHEAKEAAAALADRADKRLSAGLNGFDVRGEWNPRRPPWRR